MPMPSATPVAARGKKIVLLPDHAFFVRLVPLASGTADEAIPAQAELALEGLSPFPPAQLCYGWFHAPGSERLLVCAAYRRRFTVADAASWADADAVLPSFAAWLGLAPSEPLALLVAGPGFLTALGWNGQDAVPSVVATRPLADDATAEERASARAHLAAQLAGLPAPVEIGAPAGTESSAGDEVAVFSSGPFTSRLATAQLDALDVRDKVELVSRRRERERDLRLWRIFAGCLAALVLAIVLEVALQGGRLWLRGRTALAAAQAPAAKAIETRRSLAARIDELSTRRLMPIRMLEIVNEKRPRTIQFMRAATKELYTLEIEGRTNATPDVFTTRPCSRTFPPSRARSSARPSIRGA